MVTVRAGGTRGRSVMPRLAPAFTEGESVFAKENLRRCEKMCPAACERDHEIDGP
jgi:hypothetical protein